MTAALLTVDQAIELGYSADTPAEAIVAEKALENALKAAGIKPEDYPEKAPEAIGVFEMLARTIESGIGE